MKGVPTVTHAGRRTLDGPPGPLHSTSNTLHPHSGCSRAHLTSPPANPRPLVKRGRSSGAQPVKPGRSSATHWSTPPTGQARGSSPAGEAQPLVKSCPPAGPGRSSPATGQARPVKPHRSSLTDRPGTAGQAPTDRPGTAGQAPPVKPDRPARHSRSSPTGQAPPTGQAQPVKPHRSSPTDRPGPPPRGSRRARPAGRASPAHRASPAGQAQPAGQLRRTGQARGTATKAPLSIATHTWSPAMAKP
jgi:hypothetical protein